MTDFGVDEWDDELQQHYFVGLAMLLDMRGGSFSFTLAEYEAFRAKMGGLAQIIVTQKGEEHRLVLMRETPKRAN